MPHLRSNVGGMLNRVATPDLRNFLSKPDQMSTSEDPLLETDGDKTDHDELPSAHAHVAMPDVRPPTKQMRSSENPLDLLIWKPLN